METFAKDDEKASPNEATPNGYPTKQCPHPPVQTSPPKEASCPELDPELDPALQKKKKETDEDLLKGWHPVGVVVVYDGENPILKEGAIIQANTTGRLQLMYDQCEVGFKDNEGLTLDLVFRWNPKPVIFAKGVTEAHDVRGGHGSMTRRGEWHISKYPTISIPIARISTEYLAFYRGFANSSLSDHVTLLGDNCIRIDLPLAPRRNIHRSGCNSKVSHLSPAVEGDISRKEGRLALWRSHVRTNRLWKLETKDYKNPDDHTKPFLLLDPWTLWDDDPGWGDYGYYELWTVEARKKEGSAKEFIDTFEGPIAVEKDALKGFGTRVVRALGWSAENAKDSVKLNKMKCVGTGDLDELLGHYILVKHGSSWLGALIVGCFNSCVYVWIFKGPKLIKFGWRNAVKKGSVFFISEP